MLLRITYSNTKSFLKKTIKSFKSYFPGGYQKLPKTPPCNPFSCTGSRGGRPPVNRFNHHYRPPETTTNHRTKAAAATTTTGKAGTCDYLKLKEPNLIKKQEKNKKRKMDHGKDDEDESSKCLVTRKLKELEMMDRNNVDLVLDIEEVLHYYSRLTCPAYRDIIEKFFVELYSGTFNLSHGNNSVSRERLI